MKKLIFCLFLSFAFVSTLKAQEFTYGVMVGANAFDGDIDGKGLSGGDGYSSFGKEGFPLNVGFYGNYQLNEALGVKANLFYKGNIRNIYSELEPFGTIKNEIFISSIQFQPLFVFDVNKEYGKGFYLIAGPGIDFILKKQDVFKGTSIDALLGFGFTFSEFIGMEFIGNYGISNQLDSDQYKTSTIGGYVSLYFNLASLINN